nr:molecular chaperone DnaJ [Clostridiales bacterium]
IQSSKACPKCNGRGTIIEKPCKKCNGAGRVRKPMKLDINIPAGVDDRQIITVRGQGNKGVNGGPSGDLNIVVNVRPHPIFERDGYNVWVDMHLTFMQVALGCTVQVPTLDGKVEYSIPAGTQPGDVFKLRGRGIISRNGISKGDQLVRIIVDIPKKLTDKQKELIKQLAVESGSTVGLGEKKNIFNKNGKKKK